MVSRDIGNVNIYVDAFNDYGDDISLLYLNLDTYKLNNRYDINHD